MQYTAIFTAVEITIFSWFFFYILLMFAQNIDCGYKLELPQWVPTTYVLEKNKKIMYTPVNPNFPL